MLCTMTSVSNKCRREILPAVHVTYVPYAESWTLVFAIFPDFPVNFVVFTNNGTTRLVSKGKQAYAVRVHTGGVTHFRVVGVALIHSPHMSTCICWPRWPREGKPTHIQIAPRALHLLYNKHKHISIHWSCIPSDMLLLAKAWWSQRSFVELI